MKLHRAKDHDAMQKRQPENGYANCTTPERHRCTLTLTQGHCLQLSCPQGQHQAPGKAPAYVSTARWAQFNEAGDTLTRALLQRDPQARPTASQILGHRFFTTALPTPSSTPSDQVE
jgi:serine/threonine protein kinase